VKIVKLTENGEAECRLAAAALIEEQSKHNLQRYDTAVRVEPEDTSQHDATNVRRQCWLVCLGRDRQS